MNLADGPNPRSSSRVTSLDGVHGVAYHPTTGQLTLAATVNDVSAGTLLRQRFTCDRLGRLIGHAEWVTADTVTYAYGYDAVGRLAEVQTAGVVTATYTYDLNGNRTQVVVATRPAASRRTRRRSAHGPRTSAPGIRSPHRATPTREPGHPRRAPG